MNNIDKTADTVKDVVTTAMDNVGEKVTTLGKETFDKAVSAQEYFVQLVKNNPCKSIATAFVAGYLLSVCRNKFNN